MLRYFFSALIAAFILIPGTAMGSEYDHELKADDMTVFWRIDQDRIHVKLSAKTQGWVAIGFDPEKAMQGANIIIGAVKKGKVRIEDHYGDRKRGHSSDEKLGGENHVLNPEGQEEDGVTTISFSLLLEAQDKWDKSIDPDKVSRIMIAYGFGRDSFRAGHAWREVYEVNYNTGETQKIK
ncbi:MAG: DOMON domain-containing protein [Desulfobacter sp.]|nr:DOMON domain-containing protein [Desulfobacter sp.]WDP86822.1 MAG: DOMON domain-containing protein [Desulfobacter sp.]